MKNLRNKIVLSGLVLLFALVATIGSTFAWFTVSNTVTVAAMQLNVKSSESLLIKVFAGENGDEASLLDANNYKANLSLSDITAQYAGLTSWYMTDVTATVSQSGSTLNPKQLQTMDVDNKTYSGTDGTPNSATGNFIELKFWILSQGSGTEDVVLSDLVIDTVTANSDTQDNVVNAVRLATWVSKAAATPVAGTAHVYSEDPDYAFTFIPGMRGFTDTKFYWVGTAGESNLRNVSGSIIYVHVAGDLGTTTETETHYWTLGSGNYILDSGALEVAVTGYGGAVEVAAANIFTTATLANDAALNKISDANQALLVTAQSLYEDGVGIANVSSADLAGADVIYSLAQNVPTLFTVRIYIEGWDSDTTNAILAAAFSISFKFSLQDVNP